MTQLRNALLREPNINVVEQVSTADLRGGQLEAIREITSLINSSSDLNTIFERIVNAMCRNTSWKRCAIMTIDRSNGYSVLVTRTDPHPEISSKLPQRWELATSPSLRVAETKRPLIIEDAQVSDEFPGFRADSIARHYHTVVILPLSCTDMQSREMVLSVSSDLCIKVAEEEINFLTTVCHLAAIAVDKEKSLHNERLVTCRLERTLQINSSLLERVLGGSSMSTIAGIVESILPDQIIIIDFTADSFHIGRSPDAQRLSDPEWAEIVKGVASAYFAELIVRTEPTDFRQLHQIDLTPLGVSIARQAYVEPLQVDGETVGGLIVFPRQRGMDDLDFLIAQEAKFALSAQIMRTHIQFRKDSSQLADLFDHLFKRNWTDPSQILGRANRLGVNLNLPARLLAIEIEDLCNKRHGGIALVLRRLNTLLKNAKSGALAFELGGKIFVYLPCHPQGQNQGPSQTQNQSFDKFKTSLGRQILEATQWQFGSEPVVAFGTLCEKLEDFQTCFDQCSRLLMLARLFDRHGLVRQEDFGPFALLLSALDGAAAQEFMQQTIGQIEKYDREHATDLLKTAATFINQGCRYQATAEELQVHASTLRYRLQRLLELFNLDLDDAETRFALSLALKLRAIFGSRPGTSRAHPRI